MSTMYHSQRKSMIALINCECQQKHAKNTHLGARAMLFEVIVPVFCLQINSCSRSAIESCRSVGKLILRSGIDLLSGLHPWPFVGFITFTLLERTLDLQNWLKDVKSIEKVQPNRNRRILYREILQFLQTILVRTYAHKNRGLENDKRYCCS